MWGAVEDAAEVFAAGSFDAAPSVFSLTGGFNLSE